MREKLLKVKAIGTLLVLLVLVIAVGVAEETRTDISEQWAHATEDAAGYEKFEVEGKYGFLDASGSVVIEPRWDDVWYFHEGLALVRKDGKYGYIDTSGTVVLEPVWDVIEPFCDGFARVERDGLYGYVDRAGNIVSDAQWNSGDVSFSEGMACVRKGDLFGFIDSAGNVAIEPQWDRAGSFSEGLAWVSKDGNYGFVDKTGKLMGKLRWEEAYDFSEGLALVCQNDQYGYINIKGKVVSKPQWDDGRSFCEGFAIVNKNDLYGYIDKKGKVVSKPQWEQAEDFSEGLACVMIDEKYGFIDAKGKMVIEQKWDDGYPFVEGFALVERRGKYGLIDRSGNMVIAPDGEFGESFSEGLLCVDFGGRDGFIDVTGKVVIEPIWESAYPFSEGLALVKQHGQFGYIDKMGNITIPLTWQWKSADHFSDGTALVTIWDTGEQVTINREGKIIRPDFSAFTSSEHVAASAGAPKPRFAMLAAGESHSLVIDPQGTLWAFGDNFFGQLGTGKATAYGPNQTITEDHDQTTPVKVMEGVIHVSAGQYSSLAITRNHKLYAWGRLYYSSGMAHDELWPLNIFVSESVQYADIYGDTLVMVLDNGTLLMDGRGMDTVSWNAKWLRSETIAQGVVKAEIGLEHMIYLTADGEVWGIGKEVYLGQGESDPMTYYTEPVRILGGVADISVSDQGAYALTAGGELYAWGINGSDGDLGTDTGFTVLTPTLVMADVSEIYGKGQMLRKTDGSLWTWGSIWPQYTLREDGEIRGGGVLAEAIICAYGKTPVQVMENAAIAAGSRWHRLALDADGGLWSWGGNECGQLGLGTRTAYAYKEAWDGTEASIKTDKNQQEPARVNVPW